MTNEELQCTLLARTETLIKHPIDEGHYKKGILAVLVKGDHIIPKETDDMKSHQIHVWRERSMLNDNHFKAWPKDSIDENYLYVKGKVDALLNYINALRAKLQSI